MNTALNQHKPFHRRLWRTLFAAGVLGLVLGLWPAWPVVQPSAQGAAFVYESSTEFFTSGDFNGDGLTDALIVDKATGNARIGYDNGSGQFSWFGPIPTGAEGITGCGVGRFLLTTRDALAVTSPNLNRVNLVDLFSPSTSPTNVVPPGVGPHALAALRAPLGSALSYHALLVTSSANASNIERGDLLTLNAGVATPSANFNPGRVFDRLNAFETSPAGPTFAAGLLRGSADIFQVWRFTNGAAPLLMRTNLPSGSDYAIGRFFGETLPRLIYYRPGDSSITIQSLTISAGAIALDVSQTYALPSPIVRVYYAELSGAGQLILQLSDGLRGARPPLGGGPNLEFTQDFTTSAGYAFSGFVPLSDGRFALLSAPAGTSQSVRGQTFQWNGSSFAQVSSGDLPGLTSSATRATAWLFGAEPFVNRDPYFLYSVTVADWTTNISGLPAGLTIRSQNDGGSSVGLGAGIVTNISPAGAGFGIPNQYHPSISLFSYNSARAQEPVRVRISPLPGAYGGPIVVSLTPGNFSDIASYRLGPADTYHSYAFAFTISNDVTITYYATNFTTRLRSPLYTATYTFGRPSAADPLNDPLITSNLPPVSVPPSSNAVPLSVHGTIVYGRRNVNNNAGTIWAINLDGSNDRYITTGARPRLSPNGRFLAFTREGNPFNSQGNLWMRDMTTGAEWRLFVNNEFLIGSNWDTDSQTIYFDSACALWRTGTNGLASVLPMTNDCGDDCPAVNPVDRRIAFHNLNGNLNIRGLYVTPPGGGLRTRLPISGPATWPAWSPDGRQIAFADSFIDGVLNNGPDLFVVNPDGSGLHQITSLGGQNGFLTGALWAPDNRALVASGYMFNQNGLWIIPLTDDRTACASTPIRLPTSPGDLIDFAGSVVAAPRIPDLFIQRTASQVVVSWTNSTTSYVLETSPTLGPLAAWVPISGPYAINGNSLEVRIPNQMLAPTAFFRLRVP